MTPEDMERAGQFVIQHQVKLDQFQIESGPRACAGLGVMAAAEGEDKPVARGFLRGDSAAFDETDESDSGSPIRRP